MTYSTKLDDIRADVIASLRLGPKRAPISFTELVRSTYSRNCITYRRHGQNGELLKPMHHRFEVKGGENQSQALVRNLTMNNAFFKRLCQP